MLTYSSSLLIVCQSTFRARAGMQSQAPLLVTLDQFTPKNNTRSLEGSRGVPLLAQRYISHTELGYMYCKLQYIVVH